MESAVEMLIKNSETTVLLDKDDYEKHCDRAWHLNQNGYISRNIWVDGKFVHQRLHRVIMGEPEGLEVDHINGDKMDNRKSNLRISTRSQNARNRPRYKSNKSGYKGVYERNGKYQSQIRNNGKLIQLGTFDNRHDAARMYNFWAKDLFGEYARLNVIKEETI